MTRSSAREIAVHLSFAMGFSDRTAEEVLGEALSRENFQRLGGEDPLYSEYPNEKQRQYITTLVKGVYEHGVELDGYISKYAIGWSFARISRMAAAIMRVAMYEILYMPDIPASAAINEAVELAKRYDSPEAASFVNGILGSYVRKELPEERVPVRGRAAEAEKDGGEGNEA